jgi:SWI/SNF-related matrix-associated actin-dependent regulator 1 of chromatin subfamily A
VSFIEAKRGRALIADDMGLGKTVQALAWLQLHPELRPALIVVPASLKLNWLKEAHSCMPNPQAEVISGTKTYPVRGKIVIINYDILSNWVDYFSKKLSFKVLVMDEIHSVKNSTSKRTKAVKKIAKGIPHILGLSGTPIVNRPVEMYNALTLIDSTVIPSYKEYTRRYCGAKYNGFGWDYSGATNTVELNKRLTDTIMLRRKKVDVLKDLPDKLKAFVPIEIDNREEYEIAEEDFIQFLENTKGKEIAVKASGAAALAEIEGLKQLSLHGKLGSCIEWIEEFLQTDQKLVVFAIHKYAIDALMNKFKSVAVKVDGTVSMVERNTSVEEFQNNPKVRLFIGNIQAAGVGLTLTTASNVAFIEFPWTPSALMQAEDRCHRIGQKDSVTIHYLMAVDTIEEKIANLLDRKREVLDAVLDGEQSDEKSLLSELMKSYVK